MKVCRTLFEDTTTDTSGASRCCRLAPFHAHRPPTGAVVPDGSERRSVGDHRATAARFGVLSQVRRPA